MTFPMSLAAAITAIAAAVAVSASPAAAQAPAQPTVSAEAPPVVALGQPVGIHYTVTVSNRGRFNLYLAPPNTPCGDESGAIRIAEGSTSTPQVFTATETTYKPLQVGGAWSLCARTSNVDDVLHGWTGAYAVLTIEVSAACAEAGQDVVAAAEKYRSALLSMRRAHGSRRSSLARAVDQQRAGVRIARATKAQVCTAAAAI
jgi:hypothetical protein